jgi:hypothetical protein
MTILERPSDGVVPAANPSPAAGADVHVYEVEPDSAAMAQVQRLISQLDDRRLLEGIDDRRFAVEAIALAVEAFGRYDARTHRLSHEGADGRQPGEMSYAAFFRLVAFDTFRVTRNIGLAGRILDKLIAEQEAER